MLSWPDLFSPRRDAGTDLRRDWQQVPFQTWEDVRHVFQLHPLWRWVPYRWRLWIFSFQGKDCGRYPHKSPYDKVLASSICESWIFTGDVHFISRISADLLNMIMALMCWQLLKVQRQRNKKRNRLWPVSIRTRNSSLGPALFDILNMMTVAHLPPKSSGPWGNFSSQDSRCPIWLKVMCFSCVASVHRLFWQFYSLFHPEEGAYRRFEACSPTMEQESSMAPSIFATPYRLPGEDHLKVAWRLHVGRSNVKKHVMRWLEQVASSFCVDHAWAILRIRFCVSSL